VSHLRTVLPAAEGLEGIRIAVDCANGATSVVAPRVLREIGFDVVALNVTPNGRNINEDCGSTHPEALQRVVRDQTCRIGVAFDGDGDRAILVDGDGALVNGDAVLFMCAKHLRSEGRLPGDGIVATVMSNIGLEIALRQVGIVVHRCPVGDRSVRDEMLRHGLVLGGEQSGHIIFSEQLPTGDGILTVLSVLRVMQATGRELAELRQGLDVFPQVLLNVEVSTKSNLATEPEIQEAIADAERILGDQGRVLVRYSGTESLLRVMIEGRDSALVKQLAEVIADRARTRLG
jgi:phosphoglucosamine mutase